MSKRIKIILTIVTLTLLTVVYLVFKGLHLMTIEDHYGDNQDVYFKSKQGDIVINRTLRELKGLEKNDNRIFFIDNGDTTDLYHWMGDNKIEVYRPKSKLSNATTLTLEDTEELIRKNDLVFVIKN
jgi:hypothetical protein